MLPSRTNSLLKYWEGFLQKPNIVVIADGHRDCFQDQFNNGTLPLLFAIAFKFSVKGLYLIQSFGSRLCLAIPIQVPTLWDARFDPAGHDNWSRNLHFMEIVSYKLVWRMFRPQGFCGLTNLIHELFPHASGMASHDVGLPVSILIAMGYVQCQLTWLMIAKCRGTVLSWRPTAIPFSRQACMVTTQNWNNEIIDR